MNQPQFRPYPNPITLLLVLLFSLGCWACARKSVQTEAKPTPANNNPYTKREFEKAKEVQPGIPIQKE